MSHGCGVATPALRTHNKHVTPACPELFYFNPLQPTRVPRIVSELTSIKLADKYAARL